jgi:hypothetical protein
VVKDYNFGKGNDLVEWSLGGEASLPPELQGVVLVISP